MDRFDRVIEQAVVVERDECPPPTSLKTIVGLRCECNGIRLRQMQSDPIERDQVGRAVGIVGLAAIALIHLLDAVTKYGETRYIFFLYIVLMVSTLAAAAVLLRLDSLSAWSLAVVATAATLIAYVLSRTTGLPQASQDIGNWSDSLGLASVFVEGCTLLLGAYKLLTILPSPTRSLKERVDKAL